MTAEEKKEKNRIANKKWRDANPEKAKEQGRLDISPIKNNSRHSRICEI